jgi:hypothetical protein
LRSSCQPQQRGSLIFSRWRSLVSNKWPYNSFLPFRITCINLKVNNLPTVWKISYQLSGVITNLRLVNFFLVNYEVIILVVH